MNTPSHYFLSENKSEYLKFGLSIDCVVFGYNEGKVQVLLIERNAQPFKGNWALPGELVSTDSNLEDAANGILNNFTGLSNIFMEQFLTFGSVDRHPAGRVTTVGYYSLVGSNKYKPITSSWSKSIQWFDINDLPNLAFDHERILRKGINTLKRMVRYRPVGFELLTNKFTLSELQDLYEAILNYKFDKPNFRKKILSMDLLIQLDEFQENVSHRPAKLFMFDETRYNQLHEDGFVFDL